MITIIAAVSKNNVLGYKNKLPWKIKLEMKHFLDSTKNQNVLFGFNTFKHLPKIYQNWKIIVLTKNHKNDLILQKKNILVFSDINEVIRKYQKNSTNLFVCGGAKIYEQFLEHATHLIISVINKDYIGDVFFPKLNYSNWKLIKIKKYQLFNVKYYQKI